MSLPLPSSARLRVELHGHPLCGVTHRQRQTLLEWSSRALETGDDGGANAVVRQAPLVEGVHRVGKKVLDGLPGFLADSLPDAWGRLLTDRALRASGVDPSALTGLDRLALVGDRGPGALSFQPDVPIADSSDDVDLDALAHAAHQVLGGSTPELLDRLARAGGSAGGSRPKAWIAEGPHGLRSGASPLREGETGWLVKFRAPRHDPEHIGRIEFAYARMAQKAGLQVAQPRLFETDGGAYFASRRFDRSGTDRLHVLSAAGFLDVSAEQAMAVDYRDLLRLTRHVTRDETEVEQAFRQAAFHVFAHNRDDHLRQFAFVRQERRWKRAPAYDLTFAEGPGGEHTLLVMGEGRNPTRDHLVGLARDAGLREARVEAVLDEVEGGVQQWPRLAREAGVPTADIERIQARLPR